MTGAAAEIDLHETRLVRVLSDLAVSDVPYSPGNFAQRLGAWVDFADSMRLASFHDELRGQAFERNPNPLPGEALKAEVLHVRSVLMHAVVNSYSPETGVARLRLPVLGSERSCDLLMTYEPYHRFYAAHQREFDALIQPLQLRVREIISGYSAELAQLAAIDETMRELLSIHIRKSLAAIPRLLQKRFDFLLQEYRAEQGEPDAEALQRPPGDAVPDAWMTPDGWLGRFCGEMQVLLMAELDLRLMPILGLVEAVEEEVSEK